MRLFEINIHGKHAEMYKTLTNFKNVNTDGDKVDTGVYFSRYLDIFIVSGLLGYLFGSQSFEEEKAGKDSITIPEKVLSSNRHFVEPYFTLVSILNNKNKDLQTIVNHAFASNEIDENFREHKLNRQEVFENYARAGVEILYKKIISSESSKDEYIHNMHEFIMEEFTEEHGLDSIIPDIVAQLL